MKHILVTLIAVTFLLSCEKEPGEGGTSTIEGAVIIEEVDNLGFVVNSYPAPEERVYIIYGDNDIYDNEVRSHYDGRYKFEFLNIGSYKLFAYTECIFDSCSVPLLPVIEEISVNSNSQIVNAPDLVIQRKR